MLRDSLLLCLIFLIRLHHLSHNLKKYRSREILKLGKKNSASLKVHRRIVSVTLNGRSLKQPGLFLEAGLLAKLSNWCRRALVSAVTKNLMVTLVELYDHICRWWEKPTEGHHYNTPRIWALWQCGQTQSSSVKTHENTLGICKRAPKDPQTTRNNIIWSDEPQFQLPRMFEGNQLCSSPVE